MPSRPAPPGRPPTAPPSPPAATSPDGGFEPHPDFAKCAGHLGEWKGPSDITFGRDGTPMYIQGPHDDTFRIMATLRKSVGDGNFHYLTQLG
jgi:hypothetical protein